MTILRNVVILSSCVLLVIPATAEERTERPPTLEVLARYTVPETKEPQDFVNGVRWASRSSIYLGRFKQGLVEVELTDGLPVVQRVMPISPELRTMGLRVMARFDISDDWIVASSSRLAWARRSSGGTAFAPSVRTDITGIQDLATHGKKVVLLGPPDLTHWKNAPGGILWQADLSKGLDVWEVLYEDEKIAADRGLLMKTSEARASIEFLDDGDLVFAPNVFGVLPTVLQISSSGKLKRAWTPRELWGDEEEEEVWTEKRVTPQSFERFFAGYRVVDAVLAFPDGPAIVVREPRGDEARWRLAVLRPEVRWYDIPLRNISTVAQLAADVDDKGRIVMVGRAREIYPEAQLESNEVVVMRLPQ